MYMVHCASCLTAHREFDLATGVKGSGKQPGGVGWRSLTLDAAGVARHCAVTAIGSLPVRSLDSLYHHKVDGRVS